MVVVWSWSLSGPVTPGETNLTVLHLLSESERLLRHRAASPIGSETATLKQPMTAVSAPPTTHITCEINLCTSALLPSTLHQNCPSNPRRPATPHCEHRGAQIDVALSCSFSETLQESRVLCFKNTGKDPKTFFHSDGLGRRQSPLKKVNETGRAEQGDEEMSGSGAGAPCIKMLSLSKGKI